MSNNEILITNELDIKTAMVLQGRGLRFICTDLIGRNVYAATQAAIEKLINTYRCAYENGDGQLISA